MTAPDPQSESLQPEDSLETPSKGSRIGRDVGQVCPLAPDSGAEKGLAPPGAVPTSLKQRLDRTLRGLVPHPETIILFAAMFVTVGAKLRLVHRLSPPSMILASGEVALADVSLFLGVYAGIALWHLLWRGLFMRRLSVAVTLLIAFWSLADAAWLSTIGAQLRTEVLALLIVDARYAWPIVWSRFYLYPFRVIFGLGLPLMVAAWVVWRALRHKPLRGERISLLRQIAAACVLSATAAGTQRLCAKQSVLGYSGMALRPSSHVSAVRSLVAAGWGGDQEDDFTDQERLPRARQRRVSEPDVKPAELPNIALVFLESVGYWATTLADPNRTTTPVLSRLAAEGVEFRTTRVGVTRTNKSMFAALTGASPSIEPEKVEGVMVHPPYESLATILQRCGYRTGFFQMAKAESCHAPMFANLGFQHFWSRENLEDPSKHLSYLAGDDFALLDPAIAWVAQKPDPWLLVLITSVGHDPYLTPAWFGAPRDTQVDRFFQCVEFTDLFLGALTERIAQLNAPRDTLVCVIADHGEGFPFQHNLWGHLDIPFDEALRVPWVIWYPAKIPGGKRVEAPCSILDVTPTLLALVGFDISDAGFEGRNALGPLDPHARHHFACWGNRAPRGYVEGTTKYVYTPQMRTVMRYDLAADPTETSPEPLDPAQADQVIQALGRWQRERKLHFPPDRFVKRVLYDHWPAWSSGRNSWSYYRP